MAKSHRKGGKQASGSSRMNYFSTRKRNLKQGSKGSIRFLASLARNKSKV